MATELENFYRDNRIREADSVNNIYNDPRYASTIFNSSVPLPQLEKNIQQSQGYMLEPAYNPTFRDKSSDYITSALEYLESKGIMDKSVREGKATSRDISKSFTGTKDSMGLVDATPIGSLFAAQEGQRKIMEAEPDALKRQMGLLSFMRQPLQTYLDRPKLAEGAFDVAAGATEAFGFGYLARPLYKKIEPFAKSLAKKLKGETSIVPTKEEVGALPSNKVLANTKKMPPSMAMVNPRKLDEFGFYSKAEELANTMKQNKNKGLDFKNFFEGKGVTKEELEETGLRDLFLNNESVTKSQILNTINQNKIQFIENVKVPSSVNATNQFFKSDDKVIYNAFGKKFEGTAFKNPNTGFTIVETSIGRLTFPPKVDVTDVKNSLESEDFKYYADMEEFTNYVKSDGTPYKSADEITLAQLDLTNANSGEDIINQMKIGKVKYSEKNTVLYNEEDILLELDGEINTHLPSGNKIVGLSIANDVDGNFSFDEAYLTFRKDANVNDWRNSEEVKEYKSLVGISDEQKLTNNDFLDFINDSSEYSLDDARAKIADMVNEDLTIVDVAEVLTSRNEMFVRAQAQARDKYGIDIKNPNDSNWETQKQPGGKNYQEHLLRVPTKNPFFADQLDKYDVGADFDPKYDFRDTIHYDEANIIAHLRTTDRTTSDGKKVLYVEEFQSDWGQQGRAKGFQLEGKAKEKAIQQINDFKKNEFQDFKKEKIYLTQEDQESYNFLKNLDEGKEYNANEPFVSQNFDPNFSLTIEDYYKFDQARGRHFFLNQFKDQNLERFTLDKPIDDDTLMQMIVEGGNEKGIYFETKNAPYKDLLSEIYQLQQQLKNPNDYIPTAPYVTDSKSWTKIGIKRLMQKAKEGNYDYVAFSPGEIQVQRWEDDSLYQHYDKIIPSVSKKVAGKDNTGFIDIEIPNNVENFPMPQETFAINMNPKVKADVGKGMPLFSTVGGMLGVGATMSNQDIGGLGSLPNDQT